MWWIDTLKAFKDLAVWHPGTWFSGERASAGPTVGLNDLRAPFQLKQFRDILRDRKERPWSALSFSLAYTWTSFSFVKFDAVVQLKGTNNGALVTSGDVQTFGYFTGSLPPSSRDRSRPEAGSECRQMAAGIQPGSSRDPRSHRPRDHSSHTVTVTHGSDLSFNSLPVVSCYYLCLKRN